MAKMEKPSIDRSKISSMQQNYIIETTSKKWYGEKLLGLAEMFLQRRMRTQIWKDETKKGIQPKKGECMKSS